MFDSQPLEESKSQLSKGATQAQPVASESAAVGSHTPTTHTSARSHSVGTVSPHDIPSGKASLTHCYAASSKESTVHGLLSSQLTT